MKDLFFLFKMLFITAIIALVMQIHVGERTAEAHFHGWLQSSTLVDWIQVAVDGGLRAAHAGYSEAKKAMDPLFSKMSKKHDEERSVKKLLTLKRHDQAKENEQEHESE